MKKAFTQHMSSIFYYQPVPEHVFCHYDPMRFIFLNFFIIVGISIQNCQKKCVSTQQLHKSLLHITLCRLLMMTTVNLNWIPGNDQPNPASAKIIIWTTCKFNGCKCYLVAITATEKHLQWWQMSPEVYMFYVMNPTLNIPKTNIKFNPVP